jgi:hypothetical protein
MIHPNPLIEGAMITMFSEGLLTIIIILNNKKANISP